MATVDVDGSCQFFGGLTAQVDRLDLSVGGHPALSLHSSTEPGEGYFRCSTFLQYSQIG